MESQISEAYVKRCYRRLRELGAPLVGWFCENVIDEENATFTCDLCGCTQVRYVHVMRHRDYMGSISVGCVCAGVMEGDLMAAKERERVARNRSQRRMKFIKNGWTPKNSGVFVKRYHGETYRIMRSRFHDEQYGVWWEGKWCWRCQGQPILSFGKAAAALYHIIDPPQEVRHA